jgi:hypothetical protein
MGGFKRADGSTGFLKADGSVDNANYLPDTGETEKTTYGTITKTYHKIGGIVYAVSISGTIAKSNFPNGNSTKKLSTQVETKYLPAGPVNIMAEIQHTSSYNRGLEAWVYTDGYIVTAGYNDHQVGNSPYTNSANTSYVKVGGFWIV